MRSRRIAGLPWRNLYQAHVAVTGNPSTGWVGESKTAEGMSWTSSATHVCEPHPFGPLDVTVAGVMLALDCVPVGAMVHLFGFNWSK